MWAGKRVACAVLGLAIPSLARAEVAIDPCACSPAKPGFYRKGALSGDWGGVRDDLVERGVLIQGTYAGEVFAAPGLKQRTVVAGLAAIIVDIALPALTKSEKKLGDVHISAFGIHGGGLSSELMDIYGASNNVADNDIRLFEAWIDQPIGPVGIRAGFLSADQQFVVAPHGAVLFNATFGIISQFSVNALGPVYPAARPGVSARLELGDVVARAAVYDAEPADNHGIPKAFGNDAVVFGEAAYLDSFKLGTWRHTVTGSGYYAIVSRQVTGVVGGFVRGSYAPEQPVALYLDTGIRVGPMRNHDLTHDFASVGMAFARTEDGAQTTVELTYQAQILGWLTVQPDFQILMQADRTTAILATRVTIAI